MAAGEEDEEAEVSVDTRDFLRRFGELEEDQLAVESPFTFSVRSNIDNVKMNQFLQRIPYKLTPDFETVKKNFEAQTKKKSKQSLIDRIDQGEEEDKVKVDVSRIPMEHRDIHSNSVYSKMAGSARTLVSPITKYKGQFGKYRNF